jgi:hypothetical protein
MPNHGCRQIKASRFQGFNQSRSQMKFIITHGSTPWWYFRVHDTEDAAKADVERLEKLRMENNARCDEAKKRPFQRGDAFRFRRNDEPYGYKQV